MQKGGWGSDSAMVLPVIDTTRGKNYLGSGSVPLRKKGRIIVNSSDSTLYYYDGGKWKVVGGADSTVFATVYRDDTGKANIRGEIDTTTFPNNVGLIWYEADAIDSNRFVSNAFGNGVWVAIGLDTTSTQCYVSIDAKKWVRVDNFPKCNPYDITFYNGLFIVACRNGGWTADAPRIITSPDGRNWTVRVTWTDFALPMQCVAGGGGRVIAMSTAGTSYLLSRDGGFTWETKTGAPSGSYRDIMYIGDSTFIAASNINNIVARTTDGGETFNAVTMPEAGSYWGGAYDNGRAVVLCESCDTNKIFISDDMGATWTGDPQFAEANPGEFTRSILYVEAAMGWFVGVMYTNLTTDTFGYVVRSRTADIGSWEVVQIPDMGLSYDTTVGLYGQVGGFHHIKAGNAQLVAVSVRGKIMYSGRRECCRDLDDLPNGLQNITNFDPTTTNDITLGGTVTLNSVAGGTEDSALALNASNQVIKVPIASTTPTLAQVTTAGATTTNSVTVGALTVDDPSSTDYSALDFSGGVPRLVLFNGGIAQGNLTLDAGGRFDFDRAVDVNGNLVVTGNLQLTSAGLISGNNASSQAGSVSLWSAAATSPFMELARAGVARDWHIGALTANGNLVFNSAPSTSANISGTTQMTLEKATGELGIGNSSPSAKLHVTGSTGYNQVRMETSYTPTGTADANGSTGDIAWDADYIYIKTAAGWKRAALTTW